MQNKIRWYFKLKDGLRIVESNERLAKSYLEEKEINSYRNRLKKIK